MVDLFFIDFTGLSYFSFQFLTTETCVSFSLHAGTKWRKIKHFQMSAVLMALSDLKFRGRPLVDVRCACMVL